MLNEFKTFIMRGNVLDLAVGVIIGASFNKIVSSLVDDVIMPPIGLILGGVDFSDFFISLNGIHYKTLAAAQAAEAPILKYGMFINTIIQFLIISFAVFFLIKQINRFMPSKPATLETTRPCPYCRSTISKEAIRCPQCTSDLTLVTA